jgi:predicted Zn-dependent peptidase
VNWLSGINWPLGNEFNYNGPMLATTFAIYKPTTTADEVIREVDAVIAEVTARGVTPKELADAKVQFRSGYYDILESTVGKADLLASFTLFRNDPTLIRTALEPFEAVTPAQVQAVAKKYFVPQNRTVIDRVPEQKGGGK